MASQRRMAVFPKCAGMFFMSVIMGGSGRNTSRRKGENKAISIRLHMRESSSRVAAPESARPFPREETELRFMNSCIVMMCGKTDLHVYQ